MARGSERGLARPPDGRCELSGSFGMVCSTHWLASEVGMRLLEQGGNAFDAAVGAGLTLQVVEPHLNGPGGDLPVIFWSEAERDVRVLCGQGVAPARASMRSFRALGLDRIPGTGLLPACVPGAFGAWMTLLRDHGTLSVRDVLAPAVHYAERGFPVLPDIARTVASVERLFREEWTTSAATYLRHGVPRPGGLLHNPVLARTYRRIIRQSRRASARRERQIEAALEAFYRGFVAEEMATWAAANAVLDASGGRHSGLLTQEDLARWQPGYEPPATFEYAGLTVCKTGPWGQGPVFLQQLALLSGFDLPALGLGSADYVHVLTESAKLAFADREAWYGDPDFADVPLDELLSGRYTDRRRRLIGPEASLELRPGSPARRTPVLDDPAPVAGPVASWEMGEPAVASGDTCHVDVADRFGNLVSATPSGGWLHGSPIIPSLGFALGTRAQMFSLKRGVPNALAPLKRPRTTLSPSIALRDGSPYLAFGTPGGDHQDQWTLAFFLRHVHFGLDLRASIDAPAHHTTHFASSFYPGRAHPGRLHLEARHPPAVVDELRRRGHDVRIEGPWTLGRLCAVSRVGRTLRAAADPRGPSAFAVGR